MVRLEYQSPILVYVDDEAIVATNSWVTSNQLCNIVGGPQISDTGAQVPRDNHPIFRLCSQLFTAEFPEGLVGESKFKHSI